MNLTRRAMGASRLTLFGALLVVVAGVFTFLHFPSQEEPSVIVHDALVTLYYPGMPAERVENLLARPMEEHLREVSELKNIVTTVRPGSAIIRVTAFDGVTHLDTLWQHVRSKVAEASAGLPEGTIGPFVDDDFGRVAAASVAVTASGFSMSEMREPIRRMQEQLYTLPGVERVSLYGLQQEHVFIEFHRERLAGLGILPQAIVQQLQTQNVIIPGGTPVDGGLAVTVATSGELRTPDDLRRFLVSVSGPGGATGVPLGSLAEVRVMLPNPPESAAIYKGQPAVVVAISMTEGQNIAVFGNALRERLRLIKGQLPLGFALHVVTFQADVVQREMSKMDHVMLETVTIVTGVAMLFLGWRTGLVVGAIVPLTILGSLITMRLLGIELQTVSIAAIILALGLLVDNGIVIAEDIERRLQTGEDRLRACQEAGGTLAIPLLTSSLVIVFAFSPFFFGQTDTNDYLRSLPIVLTIALLISWVLCLTVTPLLCYYFAKSHAHAGDKDDDATYDSVLYRGYRRIIEAVLRHKLAFIGAMITLLVCAVTALLTIPYDFLPRSDRLQFQMPVQLQPGMDAGRTLDTVKEISRWLSDPRVNPDVVDSIGYVADGGPRIVLGLDPSLPAPNIAYFTVSVAPGSNLDGVIARLRRHMLSTHPEARAEPQRFSLGGTESGVVVYRVVGPDEAILRMIAARIKSDLGALAGTVNIHDDWDSRIVRYSVQVDQAKARQARVTSQDIAQALQMRYSGASVSPIRDGETRVPVLLQDSSSDGTSQQDIGSTLVFTNTGEAPVPLYAVADVVAGSEPSAIQRRNLNRAITVKGSNPSLSAETIVEKLAQKIAQSGLPPGYRIELGGEIEDSADANEALLHYLPHALVAILLLFIWQFNSFRKLIIVVASVPFMLVGVALALKLTGYSLGFMATFGLLSLAGILVNNAVLLLERVDAEIAAGHSIHNAVMNAAMKRLRPIIMTKLTCIVGLIPLMLFGGPLWTGLAITIMGGLALGTLVTLGLIPVLSELLFDGRLTSVRNSLFRN